MKYFLEMAFKSSNPLNLNDSVRQLKIKGDRLIDLKWDPKLFEWEILRNKKKTPYLALKQLVKVYNFKHEFKIEPKKETKTFYMIVRIPALGIYQSFEESTSWECKYSAALFVHHRYCSLIEKND